MSQELFELLKRCTPAEARQQLNLSDRELDSRVLHLAASFNGQEDFPEKQTLIGYTTARSYEAAAATKDESQPLVITPELRELREWVYRHLRLEQRKYLTPEVLEWARRTFNEEEFLAGLREIEATGGVQIVDLLDELEQEAASRE